MLQNHLILHLILLTQPEVTQCYEIVTHYPFRLYNTNSVGRIQETLVAHLVHCLEDSRPCDPRLVHGEVSSTLALPVLPLL